MNVIKVAAKRLYSQVIVPIFLFKFVDTQLHDSKIVSVTQITFKCLKLCLVRLLRLYFYYSDYNCFTVGYKFAISINEYVNIPYQFSIKITELTFCLHGDTSTNIWAGRSERFVISNQYTYRHKSIISIGSALERHLFVQNSIQLFQLMAGRARGDPARRQDEGAQDEGCSHHRQRSDPRNLHRVGRALPVCLYDMKQITNSKISYVGI